MHNPVNRVKDKVREHRIKIVYGVGVVTGVGVCVMFRRAFPVHITAPIDNGTLRHLLDHPEDSVQYVCPRPLAVLELFNAVHLENK